MPNAVKALNPPPRDPNLPEDADSILRIWRTLDKEVMHLSEAALWALLKHEKQGRGRRLFLQRIYGRACTLRSIREQKEMHRFIQDGLEAK